MAETEDYELLNASAVCEEFGLNYWTFQNLKDRKPTLTAYRRHYQRPPESKGNGRSEKTFSGARSVLSWQSRR